MHPASFSNRPLSLLSWIGVSGMTVICAGAPPLRHGAELLLKIVWLYFLTGARG
jgi:hypothetical protein